MTNIQVFIIVSAIMYVGSDTHTGRVAWTICLCMQIALAMFTGSTGGKR